MKRLHMYILLTSILVVASCEKPTGETPKAPVEDTNGNIPAPSVEDTNGTTPALKQWHVSTVAGRAQGYTNATGAAAQFKTPYGIAVTSDGTLYVADRGNHRIRKISSLGVVTTLAGSTEGYKDATGTDAQFYFPSDIAVSSDGNTLYVVDSWNHRIRKIALPSKKVTTIAGSTKGYKNATGTDAQFNLPYSIAVTSDGALYVADSWNHRIRKISSLGVVTTLAGSTQGDTDAAGTDAQFKTPSGIAVSSDGNTLYVADSENHRIRKIALPSKKVTTLAGSTQGNTDAAGTDAQFKTPFGIAASSDGTLYVADSENHRIRKIEFK